MAAWSCRCWSWATRHTWSKGKAALNCSACTSYWWGGILCLSCRSFLTRVLCSERLKKPSSFHPTPPELSSKGFLKENRDTLHLPLQFPTFPPECFQIVEATEESMKHSSLQFTSVTKQYVPHFVCQQIRYNKLLFFQTCISNLHRPNLHYRCYM